jgi:hypothetical protein
VEVCLNTSKYFITVSENLPHQIIVLLLSLKRRSVKLNWVSTFLGKDQFESVYTHSVEMEAERKHLFFFLPETLPSTLRTGNLLGTTQGDLLIIF